MARTHRYLVQGGASTTPEDPMDGPMTGGEFLAARLASGYRQNVVAAKAGIAPSYLSLIENGHRPLTPKMRERLVAALRSLRVQEQRAARVVELGSAVLALTEDDARSMLADHLAHLLSAANERPTTEL